MYGTVNGADAYFAERGNTVWEANHTPDKLAALVRGSSYVDGRYQIQLSTGRWISQFVGDKVGGRAQFAQWPRKDAVDNNGDAVDDATVPLEIEYATYEAALRELVAPGSLQPDYVPSQLVTQETVGPITVKYSDGMSGENGALPNRPVIPEIDQLVANLLRGLGCYPAIYVV